ncbi:flagellar hook-length control protein FliK [Porticoccaceae bacterium LTM1]|nr:flagellar hook-length control protein FliK [Porticoccaceae bacterium LTM1]
MLGEISLTGLASQSQLSSQVHSWKVGQLLQAVALSRPAADRLQLRIGGMELEARTQVPIQPGDRVTLKVMGAGPNLSLQVVPAPTATANAAEVVNHAIRQLLPRQLSTDRVMTNLVNILRSDQAVERLPVQTRGLIETLLSRLPRAEQLASHTELYKLVAESGLFRESRQLIGRPGNEYFDLKQALIQLSRQLAQQPSGKPGPEGKPATNVSPEDAKAANRLPVSPDAKRVPVSPPDNQGTAGLQASNRPSGEPSKQVSVAGNTGAKAEKATLEGQEVLRQPEAVQQRRMPNSNEASRLLLDTMSAEDLLSELRRAVEGGISRLVLNQTQSLPSSEQAGQRWVVELPVWHGEEFRPVELVIERDGHREDQDPAQLGWRVELEVNLPELGSVQAKVLIRGEKVSAALWAERESTAQLAQQAISVLETSLINAGLEVGALSCRQGKSQPHPAQAYERNVLDCRV